MKAEIISIGDEILIGQVVNTNASWLGEQLNLIGIHVHQITSISDNRQHILTALKEASDRAEIIFITGGLGPTKDDITKQTLCEYFNTKLVFNQEVFEDICELFRMRGFEVSERNRRQAEVPENAIPLKNIHGTAPGMWFEKKGRIFISLPGVPFEMKAIVAQQVTPRLQKRINGRIIIHKTVLTQGIGESWLAEKIAKWEDNLPDGFKLAYLPQPGLVRLRITAAGNDQDQLMTLLEKEVSMLEKIIPELIFGYDKDKLEAIVGDLLRERKATIATAESCSGGYISHLLTSIPGSSDYYIGSVVSYANRIKEMELNVEPADIESEGAVSKQVVIQMAEGIQKKFNTDYAIATSGIAGPDGGTKEKPVGTTWIAIASPEVTIAEKFLFGEDRGRNIRKTALQALNMLRKELIRGRNI